MDSNKEVIEDIADSSVVNAENFDIIVNDSKINQSSPEYKWGYKVKLNDLKFLAKVDVTSDENISVYNNNTLKIGRNLLSFDDLEKQGYKIRFEKPALDININITLTNASVIENISEINETNLNDSIINETLSNETLEINQTINNTELNETIDDSQTNEIAENISSEESGNSGGSENIVNEDDNINEETSENNINEEQTNNEQPVQDIPTDKPNNAENKDDKKENLNDNSKDKENVQDSNSNNNGNDNKENNENKESKGETNEKKSKSDSSEKSESESSGITGSLIKIVAFPLAFIGRVIDNPGKIVSDIEYENTISIYIERDFTNNSNGIKIGDVIELDPSLIIISASDAEHLNENRSFIKNVYEEIKSLDNVWSSIPLGNYIRVYFEENLSSSNDITVFARASNYSNISNKANISIFKKDSDI
jgi:hypothetical protein